MYNEKILLWTRCLVCIINAPAAAGLATQWTKISVGIVSSFSVKYSQTSDVMRTLIGNKMVDHSDVFRAAPIGNDPTTSPIST